MQTHPPFQISASRYIHFYMYHNSRYTHTHTHTHFAGRALGSGIRIYAAWKKKKNFQGIAADFFFWKAKLLVCALTVVFLYLECS